MGNDVCPKDLDIYDAGKSAEGKPNPQQAILEIACSLRNDEVANVRLNVGRVLGAIVHAVEIENIKYIVRTLENQISDEMKRERGEKAASFCDTSNIVFGLLCMMDDQLLGPSL